MTRLSWEEYFIELTRLVAKRSSCLSRQVGAVLVKDNRVIATGYNGNPCSIPNCTQCKRKNSISGTNLESCYAIHAEMNALLQCAKLGISSNGAKLYVTTKPCSNCMKHILQAGITEVIYLEDYNSPLTDELINLSNILCRKYKE